MATRKFFGGILILILATLACGGGAVEPNVQETVNAAVQATQVELGGSDSAVNPSLPVSTSISLTPTADIQSTPIINAQTPCGASQWRLIANGKSEQPSAAGLKLVYVQFLIQNNSSVGGNLVIGGDTISPPFATTEEGFTYPGKIASREPRSNVATTPRWVPAGFTITSSAWSNSPQNLVPMIWSFEIAETQNKISITFPLVFVSCYDSNGQYVIETISLTSDVEKDLRETVDIASQLENIKSVTEGIDIKDLGRLEFIDATRDAGGPGEGEVLTVRLRFTNASPGYSTAGMIYSHLLDNNGAVHIPIGEFSNSIGMLEAGPGQSSEVVLKYVIAQKADKYALVIEYIYKSDPTPVKTIPIFQVYELP